MRAGEEKRRPFASPMVSGSGDKTQARIQGNPSIVAKGARPMAYSRSESEGDPAFSGPATYSQGGGSRNLVSGEPAGGAKKEMEGSWVQVGAGDRGGRLAHKARGAGPNDGTAGRPGPGMQKTLNLDRQKHRRLSSRG